MNIIAMPTIKILTMMTIVAWIATGIVRFFCDSIINATIGHFDNDINNSISDDDDGSLSDSNVDVDVDEIDHGDNIKINEYDSKADNVFVLTNDENKIDVSNAADSNHVDNLSNSDDDTDSFDDNDADNDANHKNKNDDINNLGYNDIDNDSVDTLNNNDYNKTTSIPKELRSTLQEGPHWSNNNRPTYAIVATRNNNGNKPTYVTVAAGNNNSNSEFNTSTIAQIIAHRKTTINQTLWLFSGS